MNLETKPDLEKCLDRVEAWWDGEMLDRPPVSIFVRPKQPPREVPSHHADLRSRWLDTDYQIERVTAAVESNVFLAETFPKYFPNLGPDIAATCFGSELTFGEQTSWSSPVLKNIRDFLKMQPDMEAFYWQHVRQMTRESIRRGQGKWITAITDIHAGGDLLAAMREPQDLAFDFADDIEGVELACQHVAPMYNALHENIISLMPAGQPSCTWGSIVSRKRMYYHSCDFICMISAEMFRRTILPVLEYESRQTQRGIFHLDGPGALRHLDDLLALPKLSAIQWVYGTGKGAAADWLDVYRRIQSAGKGMEVVCTGLDDARRVMAALKPKGCWLVLWADCDEAGGKAFLKEVERWAAGKK